ncbi:MAG: hypothetical protein ACKOHI_06115, partial [Phycisphaerales bacterium]
MGDLSIAVRARTVPAPLVQVAAMAAVAVVAGIAIAGTAAPAASAVAGAVVAVARVGSAFGLGRLVRVALFPAIRRDHPAHAGLTLGLGVAILLWVDVTLGSLGAFGGAGGWRQVLAWATLVPGLLLLGDPRRTVVGQGLGVRSLAALPLAWCALPALAVLGFATSLPPGVAWATEFGGYDALSYHLELPRTWFEMRRIATLPSSVYSAFPNFVEAAFLHCMSLLGQAAPHGLAMAPQVLHALLGVAAAVAVGGVAAMLAGPDTPRARVAQAAGFVALLGVPWVIVTGSLAYDEMAVLLMAATAMLAWCARMDGHEDRRDTPPATVGVAVGLALGTAIGAKLTALGMVALPFAAWAIVGGTAGGARALARSAAWATEFGGYDALSYHLELPRTWFEMRRIATLPSSVYSAFPNFVEAAFLHCMSLLGQAAPHGLAMAPQVLHALLGVAAAV